MFTITHLLLYISHPPDCEMGHMTSSRQRALKESNVCSNFQAEALTTQGWVSCDFPLPQQLLTPESVTAVW